jgi:hypothetical protein
MDDEATSEGDSQDQRVGKYRPVTTAINPTAPTTIQISPRTYQHTTRKNTPMAMSPIVRPEQPARKPARLNPNLIPEPGVFAATPNPERIPFSHHRSFSQEAVKALTQ